MLLGCIGDDFTGSSDVANMLVQGGMRTTQYCGIPKSNAATDVEAGVISLKTRSLPVEQAVEQSLQALRWLQEQGCEQFYFKYCSTFDSTKTGNIGPVAEKLAEALDAYKVLVCPAYPAGGRTIYQGHLFVKDQLLNECGMEKHPLTPMVDADIRRWLQYQTGFNVGHVSLQDIKRGDDGLAHALEREHEKGNRLIIADTVRNADLYALGRAVAGEPLVTGGSGLALGLAANFRSAGKLSVFEGEDKSRKWQAVKGRAVVLSGSCSIATRGQVAHYIARNPALEISAEELASGQMNVDIALKFVEENADNAPLIYSSADPERVKQAQIRYGQAEIAAKIENFFEELASQLLKSDLSRIIAAGGETSGAVVQGLGVESLQVGPEIDAGVPLLLMHKNASTHPDGQKQPVALALKSGNFGSENFFEKALKMMTADETNNGNDASVE